MVKIPDNWVGNRFLFEDCALQLFAFGQLLELSGHIHELQNKLFDRHDKAAPRQNEGIYVKMVVKYSKLYRDRDKPLCVLSKLKCEKDRILTIETVFT